MSCGALTRQSRLKALVFALLLLSSATTQGQNNQHLDAPGHAANTPSNTQAGGAIEPSKYFQFGSEFSTPMGGLGLDRKGISSIKPLDFHGMLNPAEYRLVPGLMPAITFGTDGSVSGGAAFGCRLISVGCELVFWPPARMGNIQINIQTIGNSGRVELDAQSSLMRATDAEVFYDF